jgi:hypothetical protein
VIYALCFYHGCIRPNLPSFCQKRGRHSIILQPWQRVLFLPPLFPCLHFMLGSSRRLPPSAFASLSSGHRCLTIVVCVH